MKKSSCKETSKTSWDTKPERDKQNDRWNLKHKAQADHWVSLLWKKKKKRSKESEMVGHWSWKKNNSHKRNKS